MSALLCCISCSKSSKVVGQWTSENNEYATVTYTFNNDGTFEEKLHSDLGFFTTDMWFKGTYKMDADSIYFQRTGTVQATDDNIVENGGNAPSHLAYNVGIVELTDESLAFTQRGKVKRFKRIK